MVLMAVATTLFTSPALRVLLRRPEPASDEEAETIYAAAAASNVQP
jgi:hypothetical protein